MPGIDNYAHAGGFIGGYVMSAFFNPLTRERGDHLTVALVLLLLTFLAIAWSVIQGWSMLRRLSTSSVWRCDWHLDCELPSRKMEEVLAMTKTFVYGCSGSSCRTASSSRSRRSR